MPTTVPSSPISGTTEPKMASQGRRRFSPRSTTSPAIPAAFSLASSVPGVVAMARMTRCTGDLPASSSEFSFFAITFVRSVEDDTHGFAFGNLGTQTER